MDNRQEFISELARTFGEPAEAEKLLADIRYPLGGAPKMQAFTDAIQYWAHVLAEIEEGRLAGRGLEVLAAAARARFPGNRVFLEAARIDPDSLLGETGPRDREGERAGEWPTFIFRGSDHYEEFLRLVRDVADPQAEMLYVAQDEAAILVRSTGASRAPGFLVAQLQEAVDERGLGAEVRFERYTFRPYLIRQLRLIGPDEQAFVAENVPNTTLVRDLPQALSAAYSEVSRRDWPSHVVVERAQPVSAADERPRTDRLNPDQALAEAGIGNGTELRISERPEGPSGYEISPAEVPDLGKGGLSPSTVDRLVAGDAEIAAALARRGESQWVELKQRLPYDREIAKGLAALANSGGGVLIAGVADDGEIIGWRPTEADMAVRRMREIANHVLPDLTHVRAGQVDEGWLAWAVVEPGDEPTVTAEGAYWRRASNRVLRAELPSQGLIASDPSASSVSLPGSGPIRVFVAMSFREEEEPALVDYWQAMLRAAKQAHRMFNLIRLDEVEGDYDIVERIFKEIDDAHMVIADLTLSPPNVYLEIGYARGRGKQVIQICRYDTQLEFDVRGRRTLTYRNATTLEHKLLRELDAL